jgi:hypothetical protein
LIIIKNPLLPDPPCNPGADHGLFVFRLFATGQPVAIHSTKLSETPLIYVNAPPASLLTIHTIDSPNNSVTGTHEIIALAIQNGGVKWPDSSELLGNFYPQAFHYSLAAS